MRKYFCFSIKRGKVTNNCQLLFAKRTLFIPTASFFMSIRNVYRCIGIFDNRADSRARTRPAFWTRSVCTLHFLYVTLWLSVRYVVQIICSRTYTTVCTCLHTTHRLTSVMCKHISCATTRVLRQWGSGISVVPTGKTLSRCAFDALPQVQNEALV